MTRTRLLPMLFATVLLSIPHLVTAAVLCTTRNGSLKARPACKSKETQVDPVALGLTSLAIIRDANGTIVGFTLQSSDCDDSFFLITPHAALRSPSLVLSYRDTRSSSRF